MADRSANVVDVEGWVAHQKRIGRMKPDAFAGTSRESSSQVLASSTAKVFNASDRIVLSDGSVLMLRAPRLSEVRALVFGSGLIEILSDASAGKLNLDDERGKARIESLMRHFEKLIGTIATREDGSSFGEAAIGNLEIDDALSVLDAFTKSFDVLAMVSRLSGIAGNVSRGAGVAAAAASRTIQTA